MLMAMDKGIKALAPEDEMGERNFSYLKEIQPIWDRNCISCHDGEMCIRDSNIP